MLVLSSSCLLELDKEKSCGNGHVEPGVEECDPGVPSSYEDLCEDPDREASCRPVECTIDLSGCEDPCGNGVVDLFEECDPAQVTVPSEGPTLGNGPALCAELALQPEEPYISGQLRDCLPNCRWDREPCGYCGNEALDPGEVCDPGWVNLDAYDDFCFGWCISESLADRPNKLHCDATCRDNCQGYRPVDPQRPGCCIPNNEPVHPAFDCCDFEEDGFCVPGLTPG